MMKYYKQILVSMLLIVIFSGLIGCNASKEEAYQASQDVAETTFNEEKKAPTETTDGINYYLPDDFKVKNIIENNIILSRGKQEYILFVNPLEPSDSEVVYEELKDKDKALLQSFEDNQRFGYISITPIEGKEYELMVGIGGVKVTTKTTTNDMAENTKVMMEIANSVEYSKAADK